MKKSYAVFFCAKFGIYHKKQIDLFCFLISTRFFFLFQKTSDVERKKSQFVIFRLLLFIACCKNLQANLLIRKKINEGKTPSKGTKRRKKYISKSKQNITPKSAKHTMGSPKRRNQETQDLNSSLIARNKLCKEMGKKPKRTPNFQKGFFYCHNYLLQDSDDLNFLKTHIHFYL